MSDRPTSSESFPCRALDNDTLGSAPGCGGCAFMTGAAVAFGLMGMFEAIKKAKETREWEEFELAEREADRLAQERMDRALERERRGY